MGTGQMDLSTDGGGGTAASDELPGSMSRAVACIDVSAVRGRTLDPPPAPGEPMSMASGRMLARVMGVVRSDDRVCPIGSGRVVVCFGSSVGAALPQALAERMVGALTASTGQGRGPDALIAAVGLAGSTGHTGLDVLSGRALSACRSGRLSAARTGRSAVVIALDLERRRPMARGALRRRSLRVVASRGDADVSGWGHRRVPSDGPGAPGSGATLLVLDGDLASGAEPGLTADSVGRVACSLGFTTMVRSLGASEPPEFGELRPNVVVLVVGADPSGLRMASWADSPWHRAAVATAAAVRSGARVLAVNTGAGAGALAGCVVNGATASFDLDQIRAHLCVLRADAAVPEVNFGRMMTVASSRQPPGFDALLSLTGSERRVLFYLTGGWSAQAIADELVVSLATVRSHIRSTLRKLSVRSQLAAVAIANGLEFEPANGAAQPAARGCA